MGATMTLADHLREATQQDLEEIRRQRVELENKLYMLTQAEKILIAKFQGKGQKKQRDPNEVHGQKKRHWRMMMARAILHAGKPMRIEDLCQACSIPQKHESIIEHPWFVKVGAGYSLSPEGRQVVG